MNKIGMSEQAAQSLYEEMQEAGGHVLADFTEVGDGLGTDRLDFL